MRLKLLIAISVLAAAPAFAQSQPQSQPQPNAPQANVPKPTKADVQKVVQSINSDKTKLQTYCDLGKLNQQMAQAEQKKDTKTLQDLGKQADTLVQKLGTDYAKLMDGLDQVDENSPEGKEFASAFDGLDSQCKG